MKRVKKHADSLEKRLVAIEQMVSSWDRNSLSARSVRKKIGVLREKIDAVKSNGYADKSFLDIPIPQKCGSCVVWNLRKE